MVAFQIHPDYQMMAVLPLAFLTLLVFTTAFSIFLSAVNVYLRDTQHLTEVLMMAWFWGTPIVYTFGQVSAQVTTHHLTALKYLYLANPITPVVMTFQRAIYGQTSYVYGGAVHHVLPNWGIATYAWVDGLVLAGGVVLFLLALVVFSRLEGNFAEEL